MILISERGGGHGIGHSLKSFRQRFEAICREHIKAGRAKAFAFIFYDFTDAHLRHVLSDQGVFLQLDRLAGNKLSIFSLHSGSRRTVKTFNEQFLSELGIAETVILPAVVFFKLEGNELSDIAVVELNNDLIHGFKELYDVIQKYIDDELPPDYQGWRSVRWIKSGVKFVTAGAFEALVGRLFQLAGF